MITLDTDTRELIDGDRRVWLTRQMCAILEILQAGRQITYDALIVRIWPTDEPDSAFSCVKAQVSKLRGRIERGGIEPIVGTIWGKGLVLLVPIRVARVTPTITIPTAVAGAIQDLLASHPNRVAADRALAAMVG